MTIANRVVETAAHARSGFTKRDVIIALAAVHLAVGLLSRAGVLPIALTSLEQYHVGWILAPEVAR